MIQIEVVFDSSDSGGAMQVWKAIRDIAILEFSGINVLDGFSGEKIDLKNFSSFIEEHGLEDFFIESGGSSIEYSDIESSGISRLDIKGLCASLEDAEIWMSRLVSLPGFLQARLCDAEYNKWQNMESIKYFEMNSVDHSHLAKRSNGLPFPLEETVIDIRCNPGRWDIKSGYIEFIGSAMWLGERFFNKLNVDADSLKRVEWLSTADLGNVVRIEAQDRCFASASGPEGEAQTKLRELLYGVKNA